MTMRSVGFRLATDGKADVVNDFRDVQNAGQSAMDGVADAAEQAADRASKAVEQATDRQIAAWNKQAAAAKLASAQAGTRSTFDDALSQPGNGGQFATVNLDRSTGSAKASASVFQDAFAEQEASDRAAAAAAQETAAAEAAAARAEEERAATVAKLRAALDPLSVAQATYGTNVATADELLARGAITVDEHAAALDLYAKRLESARQGLDDNAKADAVAEAAAQRLRAQIDPLGAAQARYDDELKSHADLLSRGKISETEHAAAIALSAKNLRTAEEALAEHTNALNLNRTQMMIAQSAVMRFSDSIIAGASPLRAFALEAHKIGEVISFDDGGVAGGMQKLTALASPMNIAIAGAGIVFATATVAAIDYGNSLAKLNAIAQGSGALLGLSGEQLEQNAEAAARAGDMTVTAARDIERGYLAVAKSGDVLTGLTAVTKDFAAATGEDLASAQKTLADAFADPIQGAQDLTEKYGLLTQAQADHIAQLIQEGQQEQAQRELLDDIKRAFGGAAEAADGLAGAWDRIKAATDQAWTSAGRFFNTYGPSVINGLSLAAGGTGNEIDAFTGSSGGGAAARRSNAAANQARDRAATLAATYQGDDRDALQRTIGTLQAGINAGGTPEQLTAWTTALAANKHALDSWVPSAQKANDVAAAQAKLAAARGPAAKAAAAAALVQAQNEGAVITNADLLAQAHSRAAAASAAASRSGAGHAATLAREAASMEVAAKASLTLADAYMHGTAQGIEAEARRKAATDATKKGIDVEAEARRQLNLQVAEAVASGAKTAATLGDETTARAGVLAQVQDGTISVEQMSRALADEAALRPLIMLRTIAQGDALVTLNKVIEDYRAKLVAAHKAEDQMGLEKAIQDSRNKIGEYEGQTADLSHSPLDRAMNAAARAAQLEAAAYTDAGDRKKLVDQRVAEARAKYDADSAKAQHDFIQDQQDSIELTMRQIGLAGANDNERIVALDQLKQEQLIRRQFPDLSAAEVQQRLTLIAEQDELNAKLKVTSAAWSEIRGEGDKFADDVLNPDTWSSWGNAAKTVLKDIEDEFIKLVALNPLKNLINGNSDLPTLGSVFKALAGGSALFSGINTGSLVGVTDPGSIANQVDVLGALGHNATGTADWSGGLTWVNENGPEIADLPNGTRIYPAAESRRMMANDNGGGGDTHNWYLSGNLLTPEFWEKIQGMTDSAAVRGAMGGAQLAQANATKRAIYRIPGR